METIKRIFNTLSVGIRRDTRVRWGLGAGASVLLSAGVLGMGGSLVPSFLHASATDDSGQAALVPVPQTPLILSGSEAPDSGLSVIDMSTSTVAEVIASLPKAERYELLLYNSDLTDELAHAGQITVFVPASANFDYLPKRYIAGLSRIDMKQLALAHIVERALPLEESLNGDVVTAGGTTQKFEVDAGAGTATFGGADILRVYKAKNGYVYIINKVLADLGN